MLFCCLVLVFLVKGNEQLEAKNTSLPTDSTECPGIWEQHGNYKYCFSKTSTNFFSAKESCRKLDPLAELADGKPSNELAFLERRAVEKYWENIYLGCYVYSDYVAPLGKTFEIDCLKNCRMKGDPYAGVQGWNCMCETKENMEAYGLSEHEEVDCHIHCNAFKSCGGYQAIALLDAIGPVFWLDRLCKDGNTYGSQESMAGSDSRAKCSSPGCYGIKLTADFEYVLIQMSCNTENNFICRKTSTGLPIRQLISKSGISWKDTTKPTVVFNQFPFAFVYDEHAVAYYDVGYYYESLQYKLLDEIQSTKWIKYMGLNLNEVKSLRYDWRGKNIYWATSNLIEVSDLQNQYSKSLYWEELYHINSVALDPVVGLMFWTDEGIVPNIATHLKKQIPKIERAGMDGMKSSRLIVTADDLIRPVGLSLDSENSLLYWADTVNHLIQSCDYGGDKRKRIRHLVSFEIGKMVYFEGMLYFIDEISSTINGINITTDAVSVLAPLPYSETFLLHKDLSSSYLSFNTHSEIDVYDWHLKLLGETTDSGISREECSHMALVSPVTRSLVCECDGNYIAQNDNTCIEKEETPTIVLTTFSHLMKCSNGTLENLQEGYTTGLTFDYSDDKIIYVSNGRALKRASLTNATYTKAESTLLTVMLVTSDWMTDNIYFTCPCHGDEYSHYDIGVKNDIYERILIKEKERIYNIAIDPSGRFLFWNMKTSVSRSSMDGDQNTIVNIMELHEGLFDIGTALALDPSEHKVYFNMVTKWTIQHSFTTVKNGRMDIYRMAYNGDNIHHIYNQRYNDYSFLTIDVYEDYLFLPITGNTTQFIKQCNKRNLTDCRELCLFQQNIDLTFDVIKTFKTLHVNKKEKASSPCINGSCTQLCLLSTTYPFYRCACHTTHDLLPDNKTCATSPCKINNGGCSMHCKTDKIDRTVECSCYRGYTLQNDNRTCTGDLGWALILTTVNGWIQLDIKTRGAIATWIEGKPNLLSFDPITQRLFWSSLQDNVYAVYNSFINGSDSNIITSKVSEIITGLDINWISRRLFWAANSNINAVHMNGSKISNMVIKYYNEEIRQTDGVFAISGVLGLQSDSFNGYLYFISKYEVPFTRIYDHYNIRCVRDVGSAVPCLLELTLLLPSMVLPSFTVDYFRNKIFYQQAQTTIENRFYYKIEHTNSDGTYNSNYFKRPVLHSQVRSLTILETYVVVARQFGINIVYDEANDAETTIYTYPDHLPISGYMIGANFSPGNGTDIKCESFAKCWSKINSWICLNRNEICDGKAACHMNIDEYYCDICTGDCKMLQLEFKCLNIEHRVSETSEMEAFLNWKNHSYSKFISFSDVISYDCSFKALFNEHPYHSRVVQFEVHSLYNLHRLRQVVLSNSFQFVETLSHLTLFGPPFLLNSQSGDFSRLVNLTTMRLAMLGIAYLPSRLFIGLVSLASLEFSDNALLRQLDNNCFDGLDTLQQLTITGSNLHFISKYPFLSISNLTFLNLSDNNIFILDAGIFDNLGLLRIVDLRMNDIKLTSELFLRTASLQYIYSSVFSLCCIKPITVKPENCIAPTDDISNCENLIRNRILAYFLWLFAILACAGNLSVLIYRGFVERSIFKKPYFMFVYNLGIADLWMSIYMIIIAVQDVTFDGNYVWNEYAWRASTLCKVSGMVSMVSSEASIMFVCLITIERYLCAKFAFENIRLTMKKAFTFSVCVWLFTLCLAVVPFWLFEKFYSRSGVCISIPLTKTQNSGEDFKLKISDTEFGLEYSTTIYLGINFLLSIFIPAGQYGIYLEVKKSQERVRSTQTGRQIRLAKRLSVVVLTDCLCWLPTGILIIMAMTGLTTPQDVYAWVIVFVLPVNSAINPYLYTLAHIDKEKLRKVCSRK